MVPSRLSLLSEKGNMYSFLSAKFKNFQRHSWRGPSPLWTSNFHCFKNGYDAINLKLYASSSLSHPCGWNMGCGGSQQRIEPHMHGIYESSLQVFSIEQAFCQQNHRLLNALQVPREQPNRGPKKSKFLVRHLRALQSSNNLLGVVHK